MLKIRKTEKDPQVRGRIMLNVLVKRDGTSVTGAARLLGMASSWGVKWHNRYLKEGMVCLQTRPRSGRPSRISSEALKAVKKKVKKTVYLTAEDLRDLIRDGSGIEYMTEYTISYARFLLRSWGFTRKVPVGRHVKRASRQKIAWFRKKLGPLIEERMRAGYTACVQDEAICMADARLRKGVYTPKGIRGVYTYTGSHSRTIVFGLITLDGEGFFQRYDSFTGKEFVEFLKAACERFGKILMITDGAPQHRSKFVKEEIGRLDGVELQFLPPGCPDLNAIEEVWRQMKHAVLDVPYVRFSSMCSDIDKWLRLSLPKLDIERYLYRKA